MWSISRLRLCVCLFSKQFTAVGTFVHIVFSSSLHLLCLYLYLYLYLHVYLYSSFHHHFIYAICICIFNCIIQFVFVLFNLYISFFHHQYHSSKSWHLYLYFHIPCFYHHSISRQHLDICDILRTPFNISSCQWCQHLDIHSIQYAWKDKIKENC